MKALGLQARRTARDVGIGKDHATVFLHLTAQTLVLKKFVLFIAQSPFFWSYAYSSRQSKTGFLK